MATPDQRSLVEYSRTDRFWDDEFKTLTYTHEEFNDTASLEKWKALGFANRFTGDMCDMRGIQPSWNHRFISAFQDLGWKDIGTSYYRMGPGTCLPNHSDLYARYIDLFGLHGRETRIRRAIIFLEDWKSGHYAEYAGHPYTLWRAGDTVIWHYDVPHMAANMGFEDRYTLQITGHI